MSSSSRRPTSYGKKKATDPEAVVHFRKLTGPNRKKSLSVLYEMLQQEMSDEDVLLNVEEYINEEGGAPYPPKQH